MSEFILHEWQHMTGATIDALPRDRTILLVTSSPLEVHGPHLPTVTDICEAEGLSRVVARKLWERHPDRIFVTLPPLYVAADVLPHVGSIKFRQSTIEAVFRDLGRSLTAQGFRDIWIAGFHGGPRHFTPIEVACEHVNRRHGGRMVSVFSLLMQVLTGGNTDLSSLLSDVDGIEEEDLVGDAHGGAIETSLMLHLLAEHVDPCWREVGVNNVDLWLARKGEQPLPTGRPSPRELFRMFAKKLKYYEEETWSGNPSLASAELGARFIDILSDQAVQALDELITGRRTPEQCHSPVWRTRWIFTSAWISDLFERAVHYRNRVW